MKKLKVLRVKFESGLYRDESGLAKSHKYIGTVTAENEWKITDGIIKTKYDASQSVNIRFRDMASVIGVNYKGKCLENISITLKPLFHNNQERAFHKPASMADYERNAQEFIKQYTRDCPNAESIRFKIKPVPANRKCKNSQEADCYIISAKNDGWDVDTSRFKFYDTSGPIQNAADMTRFLANGDFKTIQDYKSDYSLYTQFFITSYSDHCRKLIKDPVVLEIVLVEYTRESDGSIRDAHQKGKPKRVFVEREYASLFEKVASKNQLIGTNKVMQLTLAYRKMGKAPGQDAALAMGYLYRIQSDIDESIQHSCNKELVKNAYRNLLKLHL